MFNDLVKINTRPKPFEFYTVPELWDDGYISKKMLNYHLNGSNNIASRNFDFIDRSVAWIIQHFDLTSESEIIDFGCGPGLYTTRFAQHNLKVTGIDFSKRSIEHAKSVAEEEKLDIEYIYANYLEYEPSTKFDLVTMITCDFCALSPEQRTLLLQKFRKLLKPQGTIILDVYSLNSFNLQKEVATYKFVNSSKFWSANDYFLFENIFKYEKEKVILDKFTIIEKSRTRVIYNWLQYFDLSALRKEFEESDILITEVFSDVAGSDYAEDTLEFVVVGKIK